MTDEQPPRRQRDEGPKHVPDPNEFRRIEEIRRIDNEEIADAIKTGKVKPEK